MNDVARYKRSGMTMPMLCPPFRGTPTAKTPDNLRQLKGDYLALIASGPDARGPVGVAHEL